MKKAILIALVLTLVSLFLLSNKEETNSNAKESENQEKGLVEKNKEAKQEVTKAEKVEIIYFYSSRRCYACQILEELSKKTVDEHFKEELESGKVSFQSVNVEKVENQEIVKKYKARGSSLFINAIRDGEDNISQDTQVWRFISNEVAFKNYLKNKIQGLLE